MTKRKRPRYGNPARQAEADAASQPSSSSAGWDGPGQGLGALAAGFNQVARRSCDECGSPVEWMTGAEAAARGIDVAGAMEFLGASSIPGKDVWACTSCDNFGVMGPTESSS